MSQAFRKYQVCLNPTSGTRSTGSGKNDENKPKCWKIADNSYLAYHLCAQNLPNLFHEFLKSKYLFEEGNFDTTWSSRFSKSILEMTGIFIEKLEKTILNAENNLTALLLEPAFSNIEVKIVQG
jgi:hypothetical protein